MMPMLGVLGAGGGPASIPNLELWLDAADLAYLGNGAAVTTWPDKSGNARDFSCTSAVIYTTTNQTPKGGPVVGGTNWVAQRAPWMASAAGEIFLVWKAVSAGDNRNLMRFTAQTGSNSNDHWRWSDNNVYAHFGTTVRKTCGTSIMAEGYGVWYTTDIYSAANDWALYMNTPTTPRYSTTSNAVGWGSTNHALGNYSGTASLHQIAEVCLFSRKLTTDERAAMFAYLNGRHIS
jgi:hypothetical protein